ncbi:hypothetical protein ENUP19_0218G0024 [Entamoeba nuttalli]|uniref:Uncharacterized protein n=2 Tax=Entamoeba nuttalli TaxID=412467 RepID=K2GBA8_ENTNP|nr:hypothetical protein ENU1_114520 [Entamoeba nuttalli P19]EKE39796.1 hypothetical protein ENU1_114520 [Entamoeba nuttalli P19]|eukprot:XP_008857875.1 hypothetical protein ENU1_114520 [Entamoeba nuttalli P19]
MNKHSYIDNRNYQSKVRAFCIALLNRHCDINLKKRSCRKLLTIPFLQIQRLYFSDDNVIDLQAVIKRRVYSLEEKDIKNNINTQRAFHRKKKNGYRESINIINDLLSEFGYCIHSSQTPGRYNTVKMDIVKSITFNGIIYDKIAIERIGEEMCKEIEKKFGNERTFVLKQNDNTLSMLLKNG